MTAFQNILLVDDDQTFTTVLARALTRRGIGVITANCSSEALVASAKQPFSHAVVDLKISQESGLKLIPELIKVQPELAILMLTGYSSISTAVDAIKLGAVNYLCKPANTDEILAAFDTAPAPESDNIAVKPPSLERLGWEHIQRILSANDGNISATARALDMHRRTLQRKLQKRPVKQ
ncbi:MAG: two-component system response regulator RegA [Pseudomonadales bacterium]